MKQFAVFVKKEFLHVLRDRKTLFILFGMPVMQILIFGFALTNEVKNARILVIDLSRDRLSARLTQEISASKYFELYAIETDIKAVDRAFRRGVIKAALIFPAGFERNAAHDGSAPIQVITDASDPNTATQLGNFLSGIAADFSMNEWPRPVAMQIMPEVRMLYNPQLKGAHNFVPGVMALVLMLVCVMMTAISIVREKENGSMEVLLVSPFKPVLVILSKALPYLFLSLLNVCSILLLSVFVLDLPIRGSVLLLFAESTLFIITCLTLGIFISIKAATQQVAMLISLMGMLLPTMLFSGFMFPIENMPWPLQLISNIVPSKWYYLIVKDIMIKGLGFAAVWKETLVLVAITAFLFLISVKNFKIRLA